MKGSISRELWQASNLAEHTGHVWYTDREFTEAVMARMTNECAIIVPRVHLNFVGRHPVGVIRPRPYQIACIDQILAETSG